ncbi:hypothetical protein DYB34_011689 [Aphanomyces astaci]|uniref:Uncharacterized protein n=1 Tax=Aphanomyces astaci TaxID=112090 RepID=A0A418C0I1_APHAT|nr:hypothetical protein DYB34_011689 [Aphanomyces astaci]
MPLKIVAKKVVAGIPNAAFVGVGGYFIYFGATAQRDQWTVAFTDTFLPTAATFLILAGVLLIPLGLVGVAAASYPQLKKVQITRYGIMGIIVAFAATLGWTLYADADSMRNDLNARVFMSSTPSLPSQATGLADFVCHAELRYACNEALAWVSVNRLVPLNEEHYVWGVGPRKYTNATLDVLLRPVNGTVGFRAMCRNVSSQVRAFGPAVALAAQYKTACDVCAQTPEDQPANLPSWLCDGFSNRWCDISLSAEGVQSCSQRLVPNNAQDGRMMAFPNAAQSALYSGQKDCLGLAITSSILFVLSVYMTYKARQQAWMATDDYIAKA